MSLPIFINTETFLLFDFFFQVFEIFFRTKLWQMLKSLFFRVLESFLLAIHNDNLSRLVCILTISNLIFAIALFFFFLHRLDVSVVFILRQYFLNSYISNNPQNILSLKNLLISSLTNKIYSL